MNEIDEITEGVEFSYRLCSQHTNWVPLNYISLPSHKTESQSYIRRRYKSTGGILSAIHEVYSCNNVSNIVGSFNFTDHIQFRWHQESNITKNSENARDVWALGDLNITLVLSETDKIPLMMETWNTE